MLQRICTCENGISDQKKFKNGGLPELTPVLHADVHMSWA
jgi:hypothetical protein